jgi:hypothetical protein
MNPIQNNKYVGRLFDEWVQHGKIIIAVDYDDTISPWKWNSVDDQEDMAYVIELLKKCKYTGAYVVVWSACNPDRFDEIRGYCKDKGLEIDSINQNPIDLPYGKDKKIYANIYLDDRAGLKEALAILETTMYQVRGWAKSHGYSVQDFDF